MATTATERVFPAEDAALSDINAFIMDALDEQDCPMKTAMQILICVEEIFVNIAHYAYPAAAGSVRVGVSFHDRTASISFTDTGRAFNPLESEDPDISLGVDERKIGGLGIYIVKKSMDALHYERSDGANLFIMEKQI